MIDLQRHDEVFVLTMTDGENRWNTTFVREFSAALDQVAATDGRVALVTTSAHEKFFSNGLDLDWVMATNTDPANGILGGDRSAFGVEFMALMGRIIAFEVPTVCAVTGHGFGAGFMMALCHDVRIMRSDRGYLCANELEIGMTIPAPELALFRHKLSAAAFHETVMLAKRWTGPAAVAAGFVEAAVPYDEVLSTAMERAVSLAHLANHRDNFKAQKELLYGQNAALNHPHGATHMLAHSTQYQH